MRFIKFMICSFLFHFTTSAQNIDGISIRTSAQFSYSDLDVSEVLKIKAPADRNLYKNSSIFTFSFGDSLFVHNWKGPLEGKVQIYKIVQYRLEDLEEGNFIVAMVVESGSSGKHYNYMVMKMNGEYILTANNTVDENKKYSGEAFVVESTKRVQSYQKVKKIPSDSRINQSPSDESPSDEAPGF